MSFPSSKGLHTGPLAFYNTDLSYPPGPGGSPWTQFLQASHLRITFLVAFANKDIHILHLHAWYFSMSIYLCASDATRTAEDLL